MSEQEQLEIVKDGLMTAVLALAYGNETHGKIFEFAYKQASDALETLLKFKTQVAFASREPKPQSWTEADSEHLKRGQQNANKAWEGVDVEKFLQREKKPMTEDEMKQVVKETADLSKFTYQDFVRAIEKFHGIG